MKRIAASRLGKRALHATVTCVLLATAACGLSGGSRIPKAGPRLVVLLTIEGMAERQRPDVDATSIPADLLAADPTSSRPFFTPCPVLRPAITSLMTGLPPLEHGVLDDTDAKPAATMPLLAEDFKAAGWTTAAFVGSPHVSWLGGLERGFELFDGAEGFAFAAHHYYPELRPAPEVVGNFLRWLETLPKDRGAFAWVHLSDLGAPLDMVEGGVNGTKRTARMGELDRAVGMLRTALRDARNQPSLLVVTSDRVAVFGTMGDFGQGFFLDPAWIRVPLVTERFGLPAAFSPPPRPADLTGVARYLEEAASLPAGRIGRGSPSAEGVRTVAVSAVPWFWCRWSPPVVAAQGKELFIHDGTWRRVAETEEVVEVDESAVPEAVRAHVAAVTAKLGVIPPRGPKTEQAVAVARAQGIEVGSDDLVARTPSLVERRGLVETLQRARAGMVQGRPVLTNHTLKKLEEARPPMLAGLLDRLLYQSVPSGNTTAAVDTARRILGAAGVHRIAFHWLAHAGLLLNERQLAEALLDAYLEMRPDEPDVFYDLACAKSMDGDMEASAAYLSRAIGAGFRHWDLIQNDPDLRALRTDRRFGEVMKSHGR